LTEFLYDLFLSYNKADKDWVRQVAARIEQERWRGRKLKVFFDEWDIRPGQSIPHRIEEALPHSRKVAPVLSPEAVASPWVELERMIVTCLDPAARAECLIPVLRRNCQIPPLVAHLRYIDFRDNDRFEERFEELIAVLREEPLPRGRAQAEPLPVDKLTKLHQERKPTEVRCIAFSPDGNLLASGGQERKLGLFKEAIWLWDVSGKQAPRRLEVHPFQRINCVTFTDSHLLASGGNYWITLWDVVSGQIEGRLKAMREGAVMSIAFSPDSQTLCSGYEEGSICFWNMKSQRRVRLVRKAASSPIQSMACSPNGRLLASAGYGIRLWEMASGQEMYRWEKVGWATNVLFSPDSQLFVWGDRDGLIHLWDLTSRREVRQLEAAGVQSIAFSPDGQLLASGGKDRVIWLWEVASGRRLRSLAAHTASVKSIAFSPSGWLLASAGDDGMILWGVPEQEKTIELGH
jgi:WD40 repeat protein